MTLPDCLARRTLVSIHESDSLPSQHCQLPYQSKKPLLDLPVEIILQIASYLDEESWCYDYASTNAFARTNRRLYDIVDPFLDRLDAQRTLDDSDYENAICYAVEDEGL